MSDQKSTHLGSPVKPRVEKTALADEAVHSASSLSPSPDKSNTVPGGDYDGFDLSIISIIVVNAVIVIVCVVGLVYGKGQRVLVTNGSMGQTFVGWCVGIGVHAALLPVINLGRWVCQMWFARQLATRGMRGRQMMSAWSALYSGSFRGIEDIAAGLGPIAVTLLLLYAGEAVVIGAIGTLYDLNPTTILKGQGTLPLMTLVRSETPSFDGWDATDRLTSQLSDLSSPLQKGTNTPLDMWQSVPRSTCDSASHTCSTTRFGIAHPFSTREVQDPPGTPSLESFSPLPDAKETLHSNFTSFMVNVICRPAFDYSLYYDPQMYQSINDLSEKSGGSSAGNALGR
ncbi:hypothetical protein HDV00_006023 [Rhizophlyctis rosea]|nr:hypothetical protein HDV00_006023 [Rhizophlyctis rosea]